MQNSNYYQIQSQQSSQAGVEAAGACAQSQSGWSGLQSESAKRKSVVLLMCYSIQYVGNQADQTTP